MMNDALAQNLDALIEIYMEQFEYDVARHYPNFDYEKSEDEFSAPFYTSELSRRMFASYVTGIRAADTIEAMENAS